MSVSWNAASNKRGGRRTISVTALLKYLNGSDTAVCGVLYPAVHVVGVLAQQQTGEATTVSRLFIDQWPDLQTFLRSS